MTDDECRQVIEVLEKAFIFGRGGVYEAAGERHVVMSLGHDGCVKVYRKGRAGYRLFLNHDDARGSTVYKAASLDGLKRLAIRLKNGGA